MDLFACSPLNTSFITKLKKRLPENPEYAEKRNDAVILTFQRRHGSTCGKHAAVRFLSSPRAGTGVLVRNISHG